MGPIPGILAAIGQAYEAFVALIAATGVPGAAVIAQAIVGGAIYLGLEYLYRKYGPQYDYQAEPGKQFAQRPHPPRVFVCGETWVSPVIVSSCSDANWLYLVCAVTAHPLENTILEFKLGGEKFLSTDELTQLNRDKRIVVGRSGGEGDLRRRINDHAHKINTNELMAIGFDFTATGNLALTADKFNRDTNGTFPEFKAGAGDGRPLRDYNMKAYGTSWCLIALRRDAEGKHRGPFGSIPPIQFRVRRDWGSLHIRDLWYAQNKDFPGLGTGADTLGDWSLACHPKDSVSVMKKKDALFKAIPGFSTGNAALCTYDYLKRYTAYKIPIKGFHRINKFSVLEAAKACEKYKNLEGVKAPLCAHGIAAVGNPSQVLQQLAFAMNSGVISEKAGIRYIHAGASPPDDSTTELITKEDIAANEESAEGYWEYVPTNDVNNRASVINSYYYDQEGTQRTVGVRARGIDFASVFDVSLTFINNQEQAEQVARIMHERLWNGATLNFTLLNLDKIPAPNDLIRVSLPELDGGTADHQIKTYRVLGVAQDVSGAVQIQAIYEIKDLYEPKRISEYEVAIPPPFSSEPSFLLLRRGETDKLLIRAGDKLRIS